MGVSQGQWNIIPLATKQHHAKTDENDMKSNTS